MKIYNEVVIDMDTGTTIHEDSFEYDGPVMRMCGGDDDDGPDYSDQIDILTRQAADVRARRGGIRDYFEDVRNMGAESYRTEGKTALDAFLSESYSVGKQNETAIRTSGFEKDTEMNEMISMDKEFRGEAYETAAESRSLDFRTSTIEQTKAYEDQMDQIEDMLYQIKTEKSNLESESSSGGSFSGHLADRAWDYKKANQGDEDIV